jgi:hypothetical protein
MMAWTMTEQPIAPDETRRFYDRISRIYDFLADSSEHAIVTSGFGRLGSVMASMCWRSAAVQATAWLGWQRPSVRLATYTQSIFLRG